MRKPVTNNTFSKTSIPALVINNLTPEVEFILILKMKVFS